MVDVPNAQTGKPITDRKPTRPAGSQGQKLIERMKQVAATGGKRSQTRTKPQY